MANVTIAPFWVPSLSSGCSRPLKCFSCLSLARPGPQDTPLAMAAAQMKSSGFQMSPVALRLRLHAALFPLPGTFSSADTGTELKGISSDIPSRTSHTPTVPPAQVPVHK